MTRQRPPNPHVSSTFLLPIRLIEYRADEAIGLNSECLAQFTCSTDLGRLAIGQAIDGGIGERAARFVAAAPSGKETSERNAGARLQEPCLLRCGDA